MLKIKQKYVIVIVEQIEGCGEEGGMAMKLEKINDSLNKKKEELGLFQEVK